MRRAGLVGLILTALALTGCLGPGAPNLSVFDAKAPQIVQTRPALGGAGLVAKLAIGSTLEVTFNEEMDPRSLRPGIGLLKDGKVELATVITAPALAPAQAADPDIPYRVSVALAMGELEIFDPAKASPTYTLLLRTLLVDLQGNPLEEERRVLFRYQN